MYRILLIGTLDRIIEELYRALGRRYQVQLCSANTSEEEVQTIARIVKPDMVLLDYEMPVCDGKQTFEMIRNEEEIKDIPVIFLTAVADKKHIAAVLQLNPAGYLLKPPNSEVLKEKIESVLEE